MMRGTNTPTVAWRGLRRWGPSRQAKAAAGDGAVRPFSLRGFTSLLLMLCLVMLLLSGTILYLAPRGGVANWSGWTMLLLSRSQWMAVHVNVSLLFVVGMVVHLAMNWSRLVGYLKKRGRPGLFMKKELASAIAVSSAILMGTVFELPPISIPAEFRHVLRDCWQQRVEVDASQHGPGRRGRWNGDRQQVASDNILAESR